MGYGKEMVAIELLLIGLAVPYESYAHGDVFFVFNPITGERAGTIVDAFTHFEWTNATDDRTYELTGKAVIESLCHWHATLQEGKP